MIDHVVDTDYEEAEPPATRPQGNTALAERPQPQAPAIMQTFSGEVIAGVSQVPITEDEGRILMEEQDEEEFDVHPTSGQVYLGNSAQRRLMQRAFGPGQWGLVPKSEPIVTEQKTKQDKDKVEVVREYALYIRGCFVGAAWGACDYIPSNDQMTRADALEGARSDAFKKILKDLGVAGNQAFSRKWRDDWRRRWAYKNDRGFWTKRDSPSDAPKTSQTRSEAPSRPAPAPAAQPKAEPQKAQPKPAGQLPDDWEVGVIKRLWVNERKNGSGTYRAAVMQTDDGERKISCFDDSQCGLLDEAGEGGTIYFRATKKGQYWNFLDEGGVSLLHPNEPFHESEPEQDDIPL